MEKQISSFPDYYVHADGYVISRKHGKIRRLVGGVTNRGYPNVTLMHNGVQVQRLLHRLVAESFCPKPEGANQVNHKDGNKQNNQASNLEWVSAKQNMRHSVETGLWAAPSYDHYRRMRVNAGKSVARFTAEEASDLMEMKAALKLSSYDLADIVGCNATTIKRIANGTQTVFKDGPICP